MAHARVVQDFCAFLHRSLNYLNKKRLHGIIMTHDSWGPAIFCCSCPFLSGTKKGGSALILTYLIPVYIGFINQLTLLPVGVGWGHFCCRLSGNFEIWPDIKGQNIRPDCQCIPSICTPLSARHDTHRIYYLCGSCLVFTLLSEIFPHPSNIHYTALRNLVETLPNLYSILMCLSAPLLQTPVKRSRTPVIPPSSVRISADGNLAGKLAKLSMQVP